MAHSTVMMIAGALLAASVDLAQHGAWAATVPDPSVSPAAGSLSPPRDRLGDESIMLRSSVTLGMRRPAARGRSTAQMAPLHRSPAAAGEASELQLQRSLGVEVPSAELPMKQALPGGELNRAGIVRASRVRIREGIIILEGGGNNQEAAKGQPPSPANAPSSNEFVAAGAGS